MMIIETADTLMAINIVLCLEAEALELRSPIGNVLTNMVWLLSSTIIDTTYSLIYVQIYLFLFILNTTCDT